MAAAVAAEPVGHGPPTPNSSLQAGTASEDTDVMPDAGYQALDYKEHLEALRRQEARIHEEERLRELELRRLEQERWQRDIRAQRAEVDRKKADLQWYRDALSQRTAQRQRAQSEVSATTSADYPDSTLDSRLVDKAPDLRQEVSRILEETATQKDQISYIDALGRQELIAMERIRGCALARQACLLDLQRLVAARSEQSQDTLQRIRKLGEELAQRREEASQEREAWEQRQRGWERALKEVEAEAQSAQSSLRHWRQETEEEQHRELQEAEGRLLEQEARALRAAEEALEAQRAAEGPPSHAMALPCVQGEDELNGSPDVSQVDMPVDVTPRKASRDGGYSSARSPGSVTSTPRVPALTPSLQSFVSPSAISVAVSSGAAAGSSGSKVAALRSALRKQATAEREGLAAEEWQLSASSAATAAELAEARARVDAAGEKLTETSVLLQEQRCLAADIEEKLRSEAKQLKQRVDLLEDNAVGPGLSPRRHLPEFVLSRLAGVDLHGDLQAQLQAIINGMKLEHDKAMRKVQHELQSSVEKCRQEIHEHEEYTQQCLAEEAEHGKELLQAAREEFLETDEQLRLLWQVNDLAVLDQSTPRLVELHQVRLEAEEAKRAYAKLKAALVEEHKRAEKLHDDLMAEQAEQRRMLVAFQSDKTDGRQKRAQLPSGKPARLRLQDASPSPTRSQQRLRSGLSSPPNSSRSRNTAI
eukprot:TRINITY_DN15608_c0_g1_i2.p1 TRINITY_DN15608_c0_g1~~TRINITY_DN15608_c0_g1_i2.p1  ORF type:complete len:706 (-),score=206.79 TRINITY_DN15608_c0_g1_i2:410-2527(-)